MGRPLAWLSNTDRAIDALVYQLYGLTDAKIKIVQRENISQKCFNEQNR
jgi:hypothetical protein